LRGGEGLTGNLRTRIVSNNKDKGQNKQQVISTATTKATSEEAIRCWI
jgi:hypothetical protein